MINHNSDKCFLVWNPSSITILPLVQGPEGFVCMAAAQNPIQCRMPANKCHEGQSGWADWSDVPAKKSMHELYISFRHVI